MKQMLPIIIVTTKIMKQKCPGGQVDLCSRPDISVSGLNLVAAEILYLSLFREFQKKKDLPTLLEIIIAQMRQQILKNEQLKASKQAC